MRGKTVAVGRRIVTFRVSLLSVGSDTHMLDSLAPLMILN
jgi:hypothetical protein